LCCADKDTGKFTTGRKQIEIALGINNNTAYKILKNLEKEEILNIKSNNRFSEVSIIKWEQYQLEGNNNLNNKVTTDEQQSNTLQELENKEYDKRTLILAKLLKTQPSVSMEKYTTDIYADYKFKEPTNAMIAWCQDKKVDPSFRRWINWMRKAKKSNELEVR
jgi:hypothetical protein